MAEVAPGAKPSPTRIGLTHYSGGPDRSSKPGFIGRQALHLGCEFCGWFGLVLLLKFSRGLFLDVENACKKIGGDIRFSGFVLSCDSRWLQFSSAIRWWEFRLRYRPARFLYAMPYTQAQVVVGKNLARRKDSGRRRWIWPTPRAGSRWASRSSVYCPALIPTWPRACGAIVSRGGTGCACPALYRLYGAAICRLNRQATAVGPKRADPLCRRRPMISARLAPSRARFVSLAVTTLRATGPCLSGGQVGKTIAIAANPPKKNSSGAKKSKGAASKHRPQNSA